MPAANISHRRVRKMGRPKRIRQCRFCHKRFGARELRWHHRRCSLRPAKCKLRCQMCNRLLPIHRGVGRKARYCSSQCRANWHARTNPSKTQKRTCFRCGADFYGSVERYCSRACGTIHRHELAGKRRLSGKRPCTGCGAVFSGNAGTRYCSVRCAAVANGARQRALRTNECPMCGAKIPSRRKYCSRACAFAAARANHIPRRTSSTSTAEYRRQHIRRAKRFGVPWEEFDPKEIHERDGWTCKICGLAVNPLLIWPHPMSASLDHVTDMSKGGPHSRANVQCSHLGCNFQKARAANLEGSQTKAGSPKARGRRHPPARQA